MSAFPQRCSFILISLFIISASAQADGWLPETGDAGYTTKAPNVVTTEYSSDGLRIGGIANTRHNLTMSYSPNASLMDSYRNNYYEVCVYCHTPHGANSTAAAPLWNRTVTQRTYTLFNDVSKTAFTDLTYSQPGPNSLTCLSCHDGATAIDSVINMPTQMTGEFRAGYNSDQETTVSGTFLDAWGDNKLGMPSPVSAGANGGHAALNASAEGSACMACHNPPEDPSQVEPDFSVFSIGDGFVSGGGSFLADDHPIGVQYPEEFGDGVDYNRPVTLPKIAFFDRNENGYADTNEVRLYDSGQGYEVECGSCHDPHGIKVSGPNNDELIPSFLRVGELASLEMANIDPNSSRALVSANSGSALCLTCHVK